MYIYICIYICIYQLLTYGAAGASGVAEARERLEAAGAALSVFLLRLPQVFNVSHMMDSLIGPRKSGAFQNHQLVVYHSN